MFLLHAFILLFGFFHVRLLHGFDEILRDLKAFLEIHKEGRGASTLNVSSLPRTDYLKRSFGYSGALLWNSLPENIRAIKSIGQFKNEINRALVTFESHSAIL